MQKRLKTIATLAAAAFAAVGGAAPIPQEWAVEVSRVRQYQFQATHGDTMELKATFWHDGEPFDLGGETFSLYWQTNAMESVYWSAPATAASNTVSAVFANTMDPGAPIVYGFLGATSGNYRASFSIRFAPGPGAVPNELPLPAATIDFAKVEVLNPPYYTKAETDLRIVELSPDLSPYATKEGLAAAASSATNYTDSTASTLRDDIAAAARSATNYTDEAVSSAGYATPSMVTNIVTDVAPSPGDYATVSNAAVNALSRAEAEAGFTEWVCEPATERGQPFSVVYRGRREQLDWWALYLGDRLIEDNFSSEINPTELLFDDTFPVTATRTRLPTMADATLTPMYGGNGKRFSEWVVVPDYDGLLSVMWFDTDEYGNGWFLWDNDAENYVSWWAKGDPQSTSLSWTNPIDSDYTATATRTENPIIGYKLGSQTNKPLQPKGDYAPATNIAKSALASDVQASLGKADTALQTAPVTSVNGKTGAVVLNTTDIQDNSTGTSLASLLSFMNGNIQGKAPLASPAFTGTPTAPTPASGDNSTKVATTAFVQAAISGISVTPLSGQTFNFATTQGVMDALKTVIETLGGTVTNAPSLTISQGE